LRTPDVLLIPPTVIAETCYLIDRPLGPTAEAAFLDTVDAGPDHTFQLVEIVDSTCAVCQTSFANMPISA
jgi:hypothetical protein